MADSAATEIRDDLVEQEVLYRRADATVRREVASRQKQLERDLKKLIIDIDVHGAQRRDARERRLAKLERESKALMIAAYSEMNGILRKNMRRIAKVEARNTKAVMRKHIP